MGWPRLFFLGFLLASGTACSEYQKLPIQLLVDSRFSALEQAAISAAADEWNRQAGYRYSHGDRVFVIAGVTVVIGNFTLTDYEDGLHIVYRISAPTEEEQYLQEINGGQDSTLGNGTLADILLIMYNFDRFIFELEADLCAEAEASGANNRDWAEYLNCLRYNFVRNLALHEMGHVLGLLHQSDRYGVMNEDGLSVWSGPEYLTAADLDAFCLIYDCCCHCE
jgi:hypothetical protein